ncbi:MAG: DUF1428 domain-containing protein [Gemmatimonadales bacterium]
MARYVDGFVLPIARRNLAAYRRMARTAGRVWTEHGALEYRETVGEDLKPKGMMATFPKTLRLRPRETVAFSWIVYKSRAHRDRVNKRVMKDKRIASMMGANMPFDPKRMLYAGFDVIVAM